jgi:alpha-L-rhamnosidase
MRVKGIILLALVCSFFTQKEFAQSSRIDSRWIHGYWNAKWIAHPRASGEAFGVYHFRRSFELADKPSTFIVHVSADNRYRLFVNGISICSGPARSDLANWNYETLDLAPFLRQGKNTLAATVWNFEDYRAYAQISYRTAFILQGNTPAEEIVNTNKDWKVIQDSAYHPYPLDKAAMQTYIVTADGEMMDGNKYDWGFEQQDYDDSRWPAAENLWYPAKPRTYGTDGNWMLVPRSIPLMEESMERLARVRKCSEPVDTDFVKGTAPFQVAAHRRMSMLLDNEQLTNAYPTLIASGGKGAEIKLTYAESLVDGKGAKGNRNEIDHKSIQGVQDLYISDGKNHQVYSPLHFRTYRYLQLDIQTMDEPLSIVDLFGKFTGYPFQEKASFASDDPSLQKIWKTGWRTARLCAMETYFDCPYYEQLQYVGDTRIQALISLFISGDDRLMRKAINDIDHSRIPDGLTQSRYPSRDMQVIPTFSLWWICMIHDYWLYRKDDEFVKSFCDAIENVLGWYEKRISGKGMLGPLAWWPFVDWSWSLDSTENAGGVPPGGCSGGSSIITLQFVYTLQRAAQLFGYFGMQEKATKYRSLAESLAQHTIQWCWDAKRRLLADRPDKSSFSQHANIMAVLTDAIPENQQKALLERILEDKNITQCTYYFKFYLFEALKKAKLGNLFLGLLRPWYDMLDIGLTTFAENPEPTRSDCHAWSASPDYELLSSVCGIHSQSPGFDLVRIEPFLGSLNRVHGEMPHPKGRISVKLEKNGVHLTGEIVLPEGVTGIFSWEGKTVRLKSGKQELSL